MLTKTIRAHLILAGSALLLLAACDREIVVESSAGHRSILTATFIVKAPEVSVEREVEVKPGSLSELKPGESFSFGAKSYVAGSKGATMTIREGKLVLKGVTVKDL